jgi:hypothetical protein
VQTFAPSPGTGDLLQDPNFVNPNLGNFALSTGSPCIGAGELGYDMGAVSYAARPKMVSELRFENVSPSLDYSLYWTNPTENTDGTTLTSVMNVKIYENDVLVSTLPDQMPGEDGQYNGTFAIQGNYRLKVVAASTLDGLYAFTREMWLGPSLTALPTGPDAYGYCAYDHTDAPESPQYQWVEISADSGGLGTPVPFITDDGVFSYALPFTFNFYGAVYDSFTIGANGWVGMGVTTEDDYSNSAIPNADGPAGMIAAYWEDLSPQRHNSGRVWNWFDAANHRLVVEYNYIEQYAPVGSFETFQVILLDPAYYPTSTGDGRIKVQYKEMSAAAQTEGTIGIENPLETVGLQYKFDAAYESHATPLANRSALIYTTPTSVPPVDVTLVPVSPPIVIPAQGGNFSFNIQIANHAGSPTTFDVWIMQFTPQSQWQGPMLGPVGLTLPATVTVSRVRQQNVPSTAPPGVYTYRGYVGVYATGAKWDSSSFQYTKSALADGGTGIANWNNWGESFAPYELGSALSASVPTNFSLEPNRPNPFNPTTVIRYQLANDSPVNLLVFDLTGRVVANLVGGQQAAGSHEVTFDGSALSSGQYFVRLQAGEFTAVQKIVLVK